MFDRNNEVYGINKNYLFYFLSDTFKSGVKCFLICLLLLLCCVSLHDALTLFCTYAICNAHAMFLHLRVHVHQFILFVADLFWGAETLLLYCCQVWASLVSNLCLILRGVYLCVCVCLLDACVAWPGGERREFGTPAWLHSPLTYQTISFKLSQLPYLHWSSSANHAHFLWLENQSKRLTQNVTKHLISAWYCARYFTLIKLSH